MSETVKEESKEEVLEGQKAIVHVQLVSSKHLGQRLVPNCGISARFESKSEEKVAVVTTSNKILIQSDETTLHMKDKIRCIASAPFGNGYDYIVVGTESQVILYDIYNNVTIFTRDIADGVNCFTVGKLSNRETVIYCGGNCAIWGFDQFGTDVYWTVTGDAVTTMCLVDYDQDGENELIIGSPDSEIRVFKDDLMRKEIMETDAVLKLTNVGDDCFAYALANGTLGAYRKEERLWRIKSKHIVIDILDFPAAAGQCTSVWDNGKKDIRTVTTGDQLASYTHEAQIVSAFVKSTPEGLYLMTASIDGTLDGYAVEGRTEKVDKTQETLREFGQQKHNLLMELSNFEAEEAMKEVDKKKELRIPANTTVDASKEVNLDDRTLYLKLKASNDVCIRAVIAFAEGMFDGDSYIWVPPKLAGTGDELLLPLLCYKDADCEISMRAFLGHVDADRLFIFECYIAIQKFSRFMWLDIHPHFKEPLNYVQCNMKIRTQRLVDWIQETFTVIQDHIPIIDKDSKEVDFNFIELAPKKELSLLVRVNVNTEKIWIYCDCMETAGDILQSLATYVNVSSVSSVAHYPSYVQEVEQIIEQMDDMYEVETRLDTDLSTQTSMVKEIIVRAEDTVYVEDMDQARKYYNRLKIADTAMRQAFLLKHNHHESLVKGLRRLNKIIEFASKLRVGIPGRDIIASCREAIREDNKEIIAKVLQYGAKDD